MSISEAQRRTESSPYERLEALGIALPPPPPPVANFVTHVLEGNLLFLSGQGPTYPDGRQHQGKVGADVSIEEAYQHARLTAINLISVMQAALGDLGRIRRIVKVLGMVNATAEFSDHPAVMNGCSDLFAEVFQSRGIHARSAVGFVSLPNQITVEIEAIVAIED